MHRIRRRPVSAAASLLALSAVTAALLVACSAREARLDAGLDSATGLSATGPPAPPAAAASTPARPFPSTHPTASPPSAASMSAADARALRHAISALVATSFTFTGTISGGGELISGGGTVSGALDPHGRKASVDLQLAPSGYTIEAKFLLIGEDVYGQLGGVPAVSGRWMRLDLTQVPSPMRDSLSSRADLTGVRAFGAALVAVHAPGPRTYTGLVELQRGGRAIALAPATAGMTVPHASVPFTAAVDGAGRLAALTLAIPTGSGTANVALAFHEVGRPLSLTPPAGQVTDAPGVLYRALGLFT
jgi:hypothetical protein